MTLEEIQAKIKLTPKELRAYLGFQKDQNSLPIAPEKAAQMMALFLRGYGCLQIKEEEQFRAFTLGAIVHARVFYKWDEARDEVGSRLRESMVDQAVQLGEQTARTIFDVLACANQKIGKDAREYLTGASKELPLDVSKVVHYRQLADLFVTTLDPNHWPHRADKPPEAPKKREDDEEEREVGGTPEQRLAELALLSRKALANKKLTAEA